MHQLGDQAEQVLNRAHQFTWADYGFFLHLIGGSITPTGAGYGRYLKQSIIDRRHLDKLASGSGTASTGII